MWGCGGVWMGERGKWVKCVGSRGAGLGVVGRGEKEEWGRGKREGVRGEVGERGRGGVGTGGGGWGRAEREVRGRRGLGAG